MTAWTQDELDKIGAADELELESLRRNGTLRSPVIMWVVRIGDSLYVRSVRGREGPWFRGAMTQRAGRIRAGGVEKDVRFVDASVSPDLENPALMAELDAAYRQKYGHYPKEYVDACVTPEARAATIRLEPR